MIPLITPIAVSLCWAVALTVPVRAEASITLVNTLVGCPAVAIANELVTIIRKGTSSYSCTYNASLLFFDYRQSYSGDDARAFQTSLAALIAKGKKCKNKLTAAYALVIEDEWKRLRGVFRKDFDPSQAPLCVGLNKLVSCVDFTNMLTPGLNQFCADVSALMKNIGKLGNMDCE